MQDWTRRRFITTSVAGGLVAADANNLLAGEAPESEPQAPAPAKPALVIDPARTVLLSMDYQNDIVGNFIANDAAFLPRVASVQDHARAAGIPVVHVVIRFRPGYPEVPKQSLFSAVRSAGRLQEGTAGAAIHPAVAPKGNELTVTRRRVGGFSGSDLQCVLSAFGRDHLVLSGVTTSGVVLSTVRAAADLDYQMNVIADCCVDRDPEVHRVLTEKVFPGMAPVITAADFIAAIPAQPR
jgi:nicotinamidase-related amidase